MLNVLVRLGEQSTEPCNLKCHIAPSEGASWPSCGEQWGASWPYSLRVGNAHEPVCVEGKLKLLGHVAKRLWRLRDPCTCPLHSLRFLCLKLSCGQLSIGRLIPHSLARGRLWSPRKKCVASSASVFPTSYDLGLGLSILHIYPFLLVTTNLTARHE